MKYNKPFLINVENSEPENHIPQNQEEPEYPFEFSRTNIWDQNFFNPENSSDTSFDLLHNDLEDIKGLIKELKGILQETFELNKKTDREK